MDDVATSDQSTEDVTGVSPRAHLARRVVLAGAGAAGVTVLATACSSYGDSGTSASTSAASTTGAAAAAPTAAATTGGAGAGSANAIAKVSEIPVGGGKIFAAHGVVIVQPAAGTIKAYSVVCPHAGCKCDKITTTIDCPCHGSKFSLKDGSRTAGPAQTGLTEKKVTVTGTSITLA